MFELIARIGLALVALVAAWTLKKPEMDLTLGVSIVFAGYSAIAYLLEERHLRNPGISGIIGVLDSACVALLLAQSGQLPNYGFVVLVPLLWATSRHQADAMNMSPLIAGTIMVGSNLYGGPGFTTAMLFQTAGVLVIGFLAGQSKVVVQSEPVVIERTVTNEIEVPADETELKDHFRALREHAQELESRSRKDRYAVLLYDAGKGQPDLTYDSLTKTMMEFTAAEGLILYAVNDLTQTLVVNGAQGRFPSAAAEEAVEIPSGLGDGQIRHRVEKQLLAWRDPESTLQVGTLTIKNKGRLVGMLAVFHNSVRMLEEVMERAQEGLETLSQVIFAQIESEEQTRRLREAEILYSVASTTSGADSPQTISARVVRELGEVLRLDHIGVFFLDGTDSIQIATKGLQSRFFDLLNFSSAKGVEGWLADGAAETLLSNAYQDSRVPDKEAVKRRVGSFAIFPITIGDKPFGFITAGLGRVDGLDRGRLETIRIVVTELGQAISRLTSTNGQPEGIMTPKEFHQVIAQSPRGFLIYLDVLKKEELIQTYGQTAIELAVRRLAGRLRPKLPSGAGLCRRDEGDFIVFLRDADEAFARSWANDAVTSASLTPLSTPDGRARIPLGLRAKVAPFAPQLNQISTSKAS